jgi:hypothetical protein
MLAVAISSVARAARRRDATAAWTGLIAQGLSSAAGTDGPTTATPPPDASRGATADLADVFIPEPLDVVGPRSVHIMEPIFRHGDVT